MQTKPIKRNKKQLNINISPYLYRKMEELISTKEFSGYSDIGELAIAQFIERYRPPRGEGFPEKVMESEEFQTDFQIDDPDEPIGIFY